MKTEVKKTSDCERVINVELPGEAVEDRLGKIFRNIGQNARIPGFRPGKAPADLIRKKYHEEARAELINTMVPEACQKAIDQLELQTIGTPSVSDIAVDQKSRLTFKMAVALRPSIKLKRYKGIKIKKKETAVDQKDVDKQLDEYRERYPDFLDVTDRGARRGDYLQCDVQVTAQEKQVERLKDFWCSEDKHMDSLGIYEKLFDMKPGEQKDITLKLPQNYAKKQYAGQEALCKVTLKAIKEKKLREIDEEFAKMITGGKGLAELKESIMADLQKRSEQEAQSDMENQVLETIMKESKFSLPNSVIDGQARHMIEQRKKDLEARGLAQSDLEKNDETILKTLRPTAEKQLRVFFILEEVAKCENIDISKEEIEDFFENIAKELGDQPQNVRKYYSDRGRMQNLIGHMREEKIRKFLVDEALTN